LKLFHLEEPDKLRYLKLIEKIYPKHKDKIVLVLGEKIQDILKEENITSIEIELINEMDRFVKIFESFKNLPENILKKIIFAMSYFIDYEDEILDIVPKYGYFMTMW
tara:strand:+ start:165 stop:485 length:321 start_codon:yes stop_codon:yes gene_type:complete